MDRNNMLVAAVAFGAGFLVARNWKKINSMVNYGMSSLKEGVSEVVSNTVGMTEGEETQKPRKRK